MSSGSPVINPRAKLFALWRAVAASAEAAAQEVEDAERALDKAKRALSAVDQE